MSGSVASAYAEVGFKDTGVAAGLEALNHRLHGWQSTFVAVMAGGVVGEAIRGFVEKIHGIAEGLDHLRDRARETRTPIEQLSEIEFAGKLSGIDNVSGMLNFLTKNIGLAAAGNKELSATFAQLGIDAETFSNSGQPAADLMATILDKLHQMPAASAHAAAMNIFGRSGFEVMRFGTGSEYLGALGTARGAGATVTQGMADKADKFIDELHIRSEKLNAAWRSGAEPIMKSLADFLERISSNGDAVKSYFVAIGDGIAAVIDKLPDFISWLDKLTTRLGAPNAQGESSKTIGFLDSIGVMGVLGSISRAGRSFGKQNSIDLGIVGDALGGMHNAGATSGYAANLASNSNTVVDKLSSIERHTADTAKGVAGVGVHGAAGFFAGGMFMTPDTMRMIDKGAQQKNWAAFAEAYSALTDKQDEIAQLARNTMPAMSDVGSYWSTAQTAISDDYKREQMDVARQSLERLSTAVEYLQKLAEDSDKRVVSFNLAP